MSSTKKGPAADDDGHEPVGMPLLRDPKSLVSSDLGGERLVFSRREAAGAVGAGLRTWDRLVSTGQAPQPMRLGRRPVWGRDELRAWVAAGMPTAERWETMRAREGGGRDGPRPPQRQGQPQS